MVTGPRLGNGTALAAVALSVACAAPFQVRGAADVLHVVPEPPPQELAGKTVSPADYDELRKWGADWFRGETFGGERSTTDVLGLMNGVVDVPCEGGPVGCYRKQGVFELFVKALDALDGVPGNLFTGNGGPGGTGFTSDLVIRFPPGTLLRGTIPVPEALHTGLDVEAGEPWPVGMVAVEAPDPDQGLTFLKVPSELGVGPGGSKRVRLGLTCALCHYSLDIDGDGHADLASARLDRPTPGSAYRPEHAWAIGNQDLHFGWLLALAANPMLVFTVLSGPIGSTDPRDARAFTQWILDHYGDAKTEQDVVRQATVSVLLHPRGSADDTPDGMHQAVQMPSIYTWRNWPYNADGALENASDRNNVVWTGSIDFTGLVGLSSDRANGRSGALYWEPASIFSLMPARAYAELITREAPLVQAYPDRKEALIGDILGTTDGVPGMLDPTSIAVLNAPSGSMPSAVFNLAANAPRRRKPADYGGDAPARAGTLAIFGTRVMTPRHVRAEYGTDAMAARYGVNADEFFTDTVSLMLDWQPPPPNLSPLLRGQWPLVERGWQVFKDARCDTCHAGPFFTDNRVHRSSALEREEFGISPPSTAGWMFPGRDLGPAIGTDVHRTLGTRDEEIFLSPAFDPATGRATSAAGQLLGFVRDQRIGYKTLTLRNVWATPPYLHDGSIGVAFADDDPAPGDLRGRLAAAATDPKLLYGMGPILERFEQAQLHPQPASRLAPVDLHWQRPDAALSLQALLLESERRKIVASSRAPTVHVAPGAVRLSSPPGAPAETLIPMASLGVSGVGHEFWVNDDPGGERITALVAFLLALDDSPCDLPGEPTHCRR